MHVRALESSAELLPVLPLAQLSVVLFTAVWSLDSPAALSTLDHVASLLPPSSQPPYIAFYSVPIAVSELHQDPPSDRRLHKLRFALGGWYDADAETAARFSYNATRNIPWFPSLRVFCASNSFSSNVTSLTYADSFTSPAMRSFILSAAQDCYETVPSPGLALESFDGPEKLLRGQASSPDSSVRLLVDSILRISRPPARTRRDCPPPCLSRVDMTAARTVLSTMREEAAWPLELSPDAFTSSFSPATHGSASDMPRGLLFFVPGGAKAVGVRHGEQWKLLTAAAAKEGSADDRPWMATVIDSERFPEFTQRYGVHPTYNSPAVVLVDYLEEKELYLRNPPDSEESWSSALHTFAGTAASSLRRGSKVDTFSRARRDASGLQVNNSQVAGVRRVGIDDVEGEVLALAQRSVVWLIVHQTWCGFSQRAMAVFRAFAKVKPDNVLVFELVDVENLPPALDVLVDGFPTVLRACAACLPSSSNNTYSEYEGILTVEELLRVSNEMKRNLESTDKGE